MARTVGDALKVRNQLLGFRSGLLALDWDTADLVAAVDRTTQAVELAAGAVVYPPDADQSRVIRVGSDNFRFNQQTGHFEVIAPEDPDTIFLPNGNSGGSVVPGNGNDSLPPSAE